MVSNLLENVHFARHPITNSMSSEWIKVYMESYDPNHAYFLAEDRAKFEQEFGTAMTDGVRQGNMEPAVLMFQKFKERFNSRYEWVMTRLDGEFDFAKDRYYDSDAFKDKWPESQEAADDFWDKRVTYEVLQEILNGKEEQDGIDRLKKRFKRVKEMFDRLDKEDLLQSYLTSLASLFDPHSSYLPPSQLEDFEIEMKLSLSGIGAELTTEDGYCTIKRVIPRGPADLDNRLRVNDRIVGVAQAEGPFVDVVDMKLRDAVRLIRGPKGTTVRLKVIPADAPDPSVREVIEIVRDTIKLRQQQASARLIRENGDSGRRLGVIDIPMFYGDSGSTGPSSSTTEDVEALVHELKKQGIDGLVLDLRGNSGGLLDESIRLTGLFIDQGPVVQVKNYKGRIMVYNDEDAGVAYDGPMLVLTDRFSASASEILAGALQDYGRAVIVGDSSTHGKGTVQQVIELGKILPTVEGKPMRAGALKLTIQQFYLPKGDSTQKRGVVPDIRLPSVNDIVNEFGEAQRSHALPWNKVNEAGGFSAEGQLLKLDALKERSQLRLATNEDYKYFVEDIARFKEKYEDRKISLNVDKRKQEKEEQKKRDKERKTAREGTELPVKVSYLSFDEKSELVISEKRPDLRGNKSANEEEKKEEIGPGEMVARDVALLESLRILSDMISFTMGVTPGTMAFMRSAQASGAAELPIELD